MRVCSTTAEDQSSKREAGYHTKWTTSMEEVYSKEAVVFGVTTCVKTDMWEAAKESADCY